MAVPEWVEPCGRGLVGIFALMFLAWALSEARRRVAWRPALAAVGVQLGLALVALKLAPVRQVLLALSHGIAALREATLAGTGFAFGYLGGERLPFTPLPGTSGFVFALQALPMVIVVSALSMLLFHWRVLPVVVRLTSWLFTRLFGVGGALGVCTAAKLFLGQTEAPLLIRPYMPKLTRAELFQVMTLGMATTSSSVMVIYAAILEGVVAQPITHILTASLIALPASLAVARVMVPGDGRKTAGDLVVPHRFTSSMQAIFHGSGDGMRFYSGILTMLITMLALVKLLDTMLSQLSVAGTSLSLQLMLGWALAPVAWLTGIPWAEARAAGGLLGEKIALNEVIAFNSFAQLPTGTLGPRSGLMMTYALCGFANFSSIGIQIGGLGSMVPERREEVIALAPRALVAGTLASLMSATVVGLIHI